MARVPQPVLRQQRRRNLCCVCVRGRCCAVCVAHARWQVLEGVQVGRGVLWTASGEERLSEGVSARVAWRAVKGKALASSLNRVGAKKGQGFSKWAEPSVRRGRYKGAFAAVRGPGGASPRARGGRWTRPLGHTWRAVPVVKSRTPPGEAWRADILIQCFCSLQSYLQQRALSENADSPASSGWQRRSRGRPRTPPAHAPCSRRVSVACRALRGPVCGQPPAAVAAAVLTGRPRPPLPPSLAPWPLPARSPSPAPRTAPRRGPGRTAPCAPTCSAGVQAEAGEVRTMRGGWVGLGGACSVLLAAGVASNAGRAP